MPFTYHPKSKQPCISTMPDSEKRTLSERDIGTEVIESADAFPEIFTVNSDDFG